MADAYSARCARSDLPLILLMIAPSMTRPRNAIASGVRLKDTHRNGAAVGIESHRSVRKTGTYLLLVAFVAVALGLSIGLRRRWSGFQRLAHSNAAEEKASRRLAAGSWLVLEECETTAEQERKLCKWAIYHSEKARYHSALIKRYKARW